MLWGREKGPLLDQCPWIVIGHGIRWTRGTIFTGWEYSPLMQKRELVTEGMKAGAQMQCLEPEEVPFWIKRNVQQFQKQAHGFRVRMREELSICDERKKVWHNGLKSGRENGLRMHRRIAGQHWGSTWDSWLAVTENRNQKPFSLSSLVAESWPPSQFYVHGFLLAFCSHFTKSLETSYEKKCVLQPSVGRSIGQGLFHTPSPCFLAGLLTWTFPSFVHTDSENSLGGVRTRRKVAEV